MTSDISCKNDYGFTILLSLGSAFIGFLIGDILHLLGVLS